MNVFFSIGIPAYKARFLNACITSVLGQTFRDFELIIINDASPEPLDEIVESFHDERIKYFINEKNTGAENVVDNWNKCLAKANGDFFVLMGDDDKMESSYLEEFVGIIKKYPELDVYHCRSKIINENSEPIDLVPSWPEYESVYDNIMHRLEFGRVQFISDFVYRTSTLKKNNGFYKLPLAWASDDISSFIAIGEKGIAHINKPLLNYRRNPLTISATGNFELKMKAMLGLKKWMEDFLLVEPKGQNDKIVYIKLKDKMPEYMYKKRQDVLIQSMRPAGLLKNLQWFLKKNQYGFTTRDILLNIIRIKANR